MFLAILITGGSGSQSKSVEIFRTDGTPISSCNIPDLPDDRRLHTQVGTMLCGGGDTNETSLSCLNFASNSWNLMSFKLTYRRMGHVSWQSKNGMVFMGGLHSMNTTEIVYDEGSITYITIDYFTLQQPIM